MGSGKNQYSVRTKEALDLPREESNAAAAAAAAAVELEPTLPAPHSDRFQERFHGVPEAGGQSPCAAAVVEAEAAAAAKKKAKKTVGPSRRGSAGGRPLLSPHAASVSSSRELSSAGGELPRPRSQAEVVARANWTRSKKTINMKALNQIAGADEFPSQLKDEVMSPTIRPGKIYKKSLWRKFLDRIGKSCGNCGTVNPHSHVSYQTVHMSGNIRHYNLIEMIAGRVDFGSNALNFCHNYTEFIPVHNYTEFIPVHGDGECFYRSFIFSYLEQVLHRKDTHEEHRLLAAVEEVARQHACLGWTSEFSRSHKAFKKLIKKVIRWKTQGRWKHGPTSSYGQEKLLEFFSSYDSANEIFTFLRFVAAIWICSHCEEFKLFVPQLSERYTLINCFDEVIHRKVFTDHVQITAIVRALGVPLRVEYLFEEAGQDLYTGYSQNDMPRGTCWPCHHEVPLVTLLYTNEHYVILYPDELCSQQIAQFNKRWDKAKVVQALVPTAVRNGSCASAVGAAVRLGWLVFTSVCNSVLSWVAGCCFCKHRWPHAPSPEFSWLSVMGSPIINSDSSCTVSACTMCIEAQHRLAFERLNGRGSFTFKTKVPAELKKTCYRTGVWNSEDGAKIHEVLRVIAVKGGVLTQCVPNNIKLPIDGFFAIDMDDIDGYQMMQIIYAIGPIIGSLWAADGYYDNTTGDHVYRRVREELKTADYGDHHAVVCFGYRLDKEANELHIHIMDNHTEEGPLRWIEFTAFDYFFAPLVTPVDLHQLRRKKKKENQSIEACVTRCLSVWEKKIMVWLISREIDRYYRLPRERRFRQLKF